MASIARINRVKTRLSFTPGFALPTILIASIVMLTVLLVGVTSTSTTRTALQSQYYEQLAHAAGDAGIAYAKACLDLNAGVPLWSDANPLKPSTNCSGVALVGVVCPDGVNTFYNISTPAACSVTINNNVRSSFSIGEPVLDSDGKATTIPNTGFVELIRASTGAVWRTYTQAAAQPAAVPGLCTGAATSTLGWSKAVLTTDSGAPFPTASAQIIGISPSSVSPGPIYFRKDFNVSVAGTYTIRAMGANGVSLAVDGALVATTSSYLTVATASVSLSVGCHTVFAKVTSINIPGGTASLRASVTAPDATIPLVVSDTSWRVAAGGTVHYSQPSFYASSGKWTAARQIQPWNATTPVWTVAPTPAWNTTSGDASASWISTTHSYASTANYPASSTTVFRVNHDIPLAASTSVKIAYVCDDTCSIYLDGEVVASSTAGPTVVNTVTLTVAEGNHRFAVRLTNGSLGPSGFLFSAVTAAGSVLTNSNAASWVAADEWYASDPNPYSYDNTFAPNPNLASNSVNLLVVGGGASGGSSTTGNGGAGGGGAGGLIQTSLSLYPGAYVVSVGAGGASVSAVSAIGNNGGNSSFGDIVAIGGGAGGRASQTTGDGGAIGGSGGGAGYRNYTNVTGSLGIIGQGSAGGNNTSNNNGGGGGGAGGAGGNTTFSGGAGGTGGAGGAGIVSTISGSSLTYGRGGDGTTNGGGFVVVSGAANTGNGGTGGPYSAIGASGAGGSGVVIVAYLTGSMSASGGTTTTSGGYTIHRFTSSGTFTVTSVP